MKDFAGKIAVITGGGTGMGRELARQLVAEGCNVAMCDVSAGAMAETKGLCEVEKLPQGLRITTHIADVSIEDQLMRFRDEITEAQATDKIHLLFNNAGIGAPAVNLEDLTLAQWKSVVDTNLTGPFLCTQEAIRIMKDQTPRGGRIINNGSISAHAPRPNSAPYTSTKHAITGLTKSTSLDGRKYDIACGQIDIGNAATELAARMATGVPQANGQIAAEPLMDVANVASAVKYMASLSLDANVQFLTVMATKMPFVGRG